MTREIPSVFGSVFFAEMPVSHFDGIAWQEVTWQASNTLNLHPGAHVLHYGSACFEGLKAFLQENGKIAIFRLDEHVKRMINSASKLHLPVFEEDLLKKMIIDLVRKAADIIPNKPGALYLRPTLIGIDNVIGKAASPSKQALLYVLASPVGDYFVPGTAMKVVVETQHQRCAAHMGSVKSGGNYASALHWQIVANDDYNAQQVLFCPQNRVQETGASNFLYIEGNSVITPALSSEFLHGVTRDSALQIAKKIGFTVHEKDFNVTELRAAIASGAEAALTGTAAVIAPVTSFIFDGNEITVREQQKCLQLREAIMNIQYAIDEDVFNWLTIVD